MIPDIHNLLCKKSEHIMLSSVASIKLFDIFRATEDLSQKETDISVKHLLPPIEWFQFNTLC